MLKVMVRLLAVGVMALTVLCGADDRVKAGFPNPSLDAAAALSPNEQSAILAGGCFWGTQAVFQHLKGVISVSSGYSGGAADTAVYEKVSAGDTGHAEAIKIVYDSSKISYGQLLKVFFAVAHDPTQLNRQGPDTGTQYRSVIFYGDDEQKRIADAYIAELEKAKVFPRPIVTQVVPLNAFYPAEAYHQDYVAHHPLNLYVMLNDKPKLAHLRREFPAIFVEK